MRRTLLVGLPLVALLAAGAAIAARAESKDVTFNKDVLPILQKNCQNCHRPGSIAPMSLLSYEESRPWARSMKLKVQSRQMPPWFADPQYGHFANDRSLKQADIDTIVQWADSGAPAGDPKDAPAPIAWPADGWQIKPDIIVRGATFQVPAHPANNVIEWTNIVVPSGFTKDTWVTSMELKPTDTSVTHHICIVFKPHTPDVQGTSRRSGSTSRAMKTAWRSRRQSRCPGEAPTRRTRGSGLEVCTCRVIKQRTIVRTMPASSSRPAPTSSSRCTTHRAARMPSTCRCSDLR